MDCKHTLSFKQIAQLTESWSLSKPITYTCAQCHRPCELEFKSEWRALADALPLLIGLIALLAYHSSVKVKSIFTALPGVVIAVILVLAARYALIYLLYRLGKFKFSSAEYHGIINSSKKK